MSNITKFFLFKSIIDTGKINANNISLMDEALRCVRIKLYFRIEM